MKHVKAMGADERLSGIADPTRDYIYLRVTDSGEGIAASDLDRIFEPFFTTKGGQRGTGLGLPVVHSVVEGHGGLVHVKSAPGAGTVFSIYLPMSTDDTEAPLLSGTLPESVHGHERIMVVDDNEDIADALALGLTRLGYDAVAVNDPLEALEAFKEDPGAFDAVITDQVMPQLRGLDLIARLKAIRPDIKVLLCTGYSDNISESVALAAGASCFHIKPVDAASLAVSLRRLLDAPH
jgi:CheY-like chemotaxis protein